MSRPSDGLATAEWKEVRRLRRENRILREEREILNVVAAVVARKTGPKSERWSAL